MKKLLVAALVSSIAAGAGAKVKQGAHGYPIDPVSFTAVKVTDGFWAQRLKASREVTIPLAFSKCEETGRYENFVKAANPSDSYKVGGYSFDDTDVYKTIEGASYLLQTYPDKKLVAYIDSVIAIMAPAQEPDGYLYTSRTMNPKHPHNWAGSKRWEKVEDLSHEFYNLGHMVEGAIAHYQATGKRNFLDIAIRYADCVCREIGPNPGQEVRVPGHQIAEMALAKLYLVTGDQKYLDQAKFFLDMRGKTTIKTQYSQSHEPVIDQDEAVGHAVRAGYMYAGMADVAALTGDSSYIKAIDRIWDNIITKKYYLTGGVGATASGEAYGKNYELPNMSAYCETCAAISIVYVSHRLFLLHGESKYYDALERTLYNGVLSGISLDGGAFFYPNPLQSMGQHQRQPWFGCACCPSNACRFIPSVPGYVYAVKDNNLYVNLFMSNNADLKINGKKVAISQETAYPWNGDIAISVSPKGSQQFALKIRVPGWVKGTPVPGSTLYRYNDGKDLSYTITVNGEQVGAVAQDGYFTIDRKWKKGDQVRVHFEMQPRTVKADARVMADRGRVAVERGPILYCAEWPDNNFDVLTALMSREPKFTVTDGKVLEYPVQNITTTAQVLKYDTEGMLEAEKVSLKMIPYYSWAHRGNGNMAVWIPDDVSAVTPKPQPTIASKSKISCSARVGSLKSLADGLVPADANDRTMPYMHWWPRKGTQEWVQYTFPEAMKVSSCEVYWFDDAPWGETRVPASWKVLYQDESGNWVEVKNPSSYGVERGTPNIVKFEAVSTKALRLQLQLQERFAAGISEWTIK